MVTLDYKLSPEWNPHELDLRSADGPTLRYDAFPGDVVLRVNDADFSAQWGWVPVLDFALALDTISERLAGHDHELFEFTESGATIDFRRNGDVVAIGASYTQSLAELRLPVLAAATAEFVVRVKQGLTAAHPALADNEFFVELG